MSADGRIRAAGAPAASGAIDGYLDSCRKVLIRGTDADLRRYARASDRLLASLRGLKVDPTIGFAFPCTSPWPFRIARKDGMIFVLFDDPDGEGEFLVPFAEAEIVDLG